MENELSPPAKLRRLIKHRHVKSFPRQKGSFTAVVRSLHPHILGIKVHFRAFSDLFKTITALNIIQHVLDVSLLQHLIQVN